MPAETLKAGSSFLGYEEKKGGRAERQRPQTRMEAEERPSSDLSDSRNRDGTKVCMIKAN